MNDAFPRVIFVNRVYRPSQAATAQLLTDLAEGLAAQGRDVHVIAAGEEPGLRQGVTLHRTGEGAHHGGLVSRALNYGRFIRRARRQLAALVQPGDIVVAMTDPPMLGAAIAGTVTRRGAHLVHWIQDIYPEIAALHLGAAFGLPLWPLRRMRDASWKSALRCVTLGEEMSQTISGAGVPRSRIAVVPNWAPKELQTESPAGAIAAQRAEWAVADKFVVAYSGNLGRVHEFATVLAAAAQLQSRPEIVFLFIGAGARFDEVRSAARSHGLTNLRFLSPVPRDQLGTALAAADVHLVTLKSEFSGLVYPSKLAGVLAAGRPALFVGPPGGDIACMLKHEQCGATVPPGAGRQLAETISRMHANDGSRLELGRRARLVYQRQYSFESILPLWAEILRPVPATR